jgi:hypothetical protein
VLKGGDGLLEARLSGGSSPKLNDTLTVRKQRSNPRPKASQMLSGARSISILSPTKEENLAGCSPEADRSTRQERTSVTPRTQSDRNIHRLSDNPSAAIPATYGGPENAGAKTYTADSSQPLQEHALADCPPPFEFKGSSPVAKSNYLLKQTLLLRPHEPEPSVPCQTYPDITISRISSSGKANLAPGSMRRISVSESELRSKMPIRRLLRPSKSTYGDSARRIAVQDFAAPRDPLARISVAKDLASLAELAQVLEEESSETGVEVKIATSEISTTPTQLKEPDMHRERRTQRIIEMVNVKEKENKLKPRIVPSASYRPQAIEGSDYSHFSGRTPSPKKNNLEQIPTQSVCSTNGNGPRSGISTQKSSSFEVHFEKSQVPVNESPRVSVKTLAAKFNNEDSSMTPAPSPTKSISKATTAEIQACSNSPKEKVIAPYTTNPPSPTKSQKSGTSDVSLHSVRIPPTIDRNIIKPSPPRTLLRSDLSNSTPLRSVPKQASVLPPAACYSPKISSQRLSLYDGPSGQLSTQSSPEEPTICPMSLQVHFEPKGTSTAIQRAVARSNVIEAQSVPVVIKPLTSQPPTRSNSLLYAQIRNLQQQLNSKMIEVRHLKRQISTRGALDIGTLCEELREAKKDVQAWKTRAEVAEKQLQVMAILSTRNSATQNSTNPSSVAVGHSASIPSRTNYTEDSLTVASKISRVLHGVDGASSHPGLSECSTGTVVRDIREEVAQESEYSMFVEQTMNATEFMAAQGPEGFHGSA